MERILRGLAAAAVFPPTAMAVTALGFLVGRGVPETAWAAWWLGVAAAIGVAWWQGGARGAVAALAWGVATFFCADLLLYGQIGDYFHYHYPQALLLEGGWNPVFASSMGEASEAMGVALDTVRPVHTFCFPLALTQFGAVTDWATRSLCGFVWAVFLFAPAVFWLAWSTFRGQVSPRLGALGCVGLAVALLVANRAHPFGFVPLDAVIFLMEVALLLCGRWMLCGEARWPWVWAGLSALVLLGLKQSGVLFVLLFAGMAMGVFAVRGAWRGVWGVTVWALWVAVGGMALWFHPYLTNWADYGGPLFPMQTFWPAWEGWDVTVDLGASPAANRPSLVRFVLARPLWCAFFAAGCLAWRNARARVWLALAALPMAVLFVGPSKTYAMGRYAPALPIVGLFACLALWEAGEGLRRLAKRVLLPAWVFSIAAMFALGVPRLISFWSVATDVQTVFSVTPEEAKDFRIVSTHAVLPKSNPMAACMFGNAHVYPLRPHTYFLRTIFARRGLCVQEDYAMGHEEGNGTYAGITDLWLRVSRESSVWRRMTPRPLRLEGILTQPARAWREWRRRWVEGAR